MADVPITYGSGNASIAAETIGTHTYQVIKVVGGETGSTSVLGVNPDRSINVSVVGVVNMAGSILAVPTGNQSVSGAVTATAPPGSVMATTAPAASVMAVRTDSASVITTQIAGSVMAIAGTFTTPAGSIQSTTTPAGSVLAVRTDNASVITTQPAGSVMNISGTVTNPAGSIQSHTNPAGSVTAVSGTFTTPAGSIQSTTNPAGSVGAQIAYQLAGSILATSATVLPGSVSGAITAPPGSVMAVRTDNASVITLQLAGSIMATSATVLPGSVSGAITAPPGSVLAVRTDLASVITTQIAGSVMATSAVQPAGSIMTVVTPAGSVQAVIFGNASIVGTYAEDAPAASGDKGFLVMGARNDTLASVTSNDGDYSSHVVGPSGELITANAPLTKWIQAQSSVMYGTSVQVVAAQGASVFTYITGVYIANDSATFSRVKVTGGLGSVLGWTVAPANGGSNMPIANALKTGENSGVSVSISGVSSVYVTMTGFIAKI